MATKAAATPCDSVLRYLSAARPESWSTKDPVDRTVKSSPGPPEWRSSVRHEGLASQSPTAAGDVAMPA